MLWCPNDYSEVFLVSPAMVDQDWYPADVFSHTFEEWTTSPIECSDTRVTYLNAGIFRQDKKGDWVDGSDYLTLDTSSRTIESIATTAIDDKFRVNIEGVANDGQCTENYFYIENPCVRNSLSLSNALGLVDEVYFIGESTLTIEPPLLQTTVSVDKCPLAFSYSVWSDEGAWITEGNALDGGFLAPLIQAFDSKTG